jgi:hypothetical protein
MALSSTSMYILLYKKYNLISNLCCHASWELSDYVLNVNSLSTDIYTHQAMFCTSLRKRKEWAAVPPALLVVQQPQWKGEFYPKHMLTFY